MSNSNQTSSTSSTQNSTTIASHNSTTSSSTANSTSTATKQTGVAPPCKSNYYLNKTQNLCFQCHKSCQTCNGPNKGECLTCPARMYYVQNTKDGNVCVANCESVGLYYDAATQLCVGCHPACETCFGPDNDDCFECSDGFVQIDKTTCDTKCTPQNSYIVDNQCKSCNQYCKSCYGPNINECTDCIAPYSLDLEYNDTCTFNETLMQLIDSKYTPPMPTWEKVLIFFSIVSLFPLGYIIYKIGYRIWISYQSKRDRSYNVFDKAELTPAERKNMLRWEFTVPPEIATKVTQQQKLTGTDHEIILDFKNENEIILLKSAIQIPQCARFRYFEVEVLENKNDCAIFVGIIEAKEPFSNTPATIEELKGNQTVYIHGGEGYYIFNLKERKIPKGLVMSEFGDCVGICMHYQDGNDVAAELADIELEANPKKKREQLIQQFKKDLNLEDQLRVLIFKDGICVSSPDQLDKDKVKLEMNGKYFIFVGSNGPCQVSVNVGGKIFRAHHDEVNKGMITADVHKEVRKNKKSKSKVTNVSKSLTNQGP